MYIDAPSREEEDVLANQLRIRNLGDLNIMLNMILDDPEHPAYNLLKYAIEHYQEFSDFNYDGPWWKSTLQMSINKGYLNHVMSE